MKKRKILYLFPLAALVLSGCTFQEGWETAKTWMSDHIFTPIANLFNGGSKDSGKKPSGGNTPAPSTDSDTEEIVAEEVGSVDNPLTVSQFQTLCEENLASSYAGIETGKSVTDFAHIAYLKAKVSSNTWNSDGTKIQYLNLVDQNNSSLQVTGMFVVVDASVTGDYSAKDSLKGLEVVVKGYPALYNKNGTKTYELVSKDKSDTENPRLMKVFAPEPTPGLNYGTLDNPLTVTQAKALIDQENPTNVKAYVTGEVKSNDAYDASYKNVMRITITDGATDLVIFKCGTFPSDVAPTSITQNSLKGKTVVANGIGELYQSTTYELTAPQIFSIEGEDIPPVVIDNYGTLENPLSISEAKAVIDLQDPTTQDLYVTGTVKSNTAWSTQYNNVDIVLTDGQNDFTLYRCGTLPESAQPAANALVDKVVVAHGIGTLYNTTYELKQGCVVDSINDPAPIAVESVVLSTEQVELQKGQSVKITASVLPAEASQEVEWSLTGEISRSLLSEGPATYDTETNILTAVDTGRATLTATSVADGTVSASCSIEITEATRELSGIEIIESEPKLAYNAGEDYGHEGLTVQALYDNGDKADVTDLVDWSYSKATAEVGDDELVVTATYVENEVEKSDSVTLQVTVSDPKGSLTNPYTGAEAAAVAAGLADKTPTEASYYIEGVVTEFNETFNPTYGNYSFTIEGGFVGWRLKNGSDKANFNEGDIEIGDTVIMYVQIQNYGGTPESSGGYVHSVTKGVISSVVISGTPEQTEYGVGSTYNNNGLIATVTFESGHSFDVSKKATWDFSKTTAELGDTEITVTATYGGVTSESFTINVTVSSDVPVESVVAFTLGDDGDASHVDGSATETYSETVDGKTLSLTTGVKMFKGARDAKGNGCLKFGTSSAGGSFSISLSGLTGLTKVRIYVAQYKSRSDCKVTFNNGAETTISSKSDNGEYDMLEVTLSSETSIPVSFSGRAMLNTIEFVF